jgi:uncharacterized protein involved in type VI secretion and phage assembly
VSDRIYGVVPATVESLEDDDKLGRVVLRYKWMSKKEPKTPPARIATALAGKDRGLQFMPEVGDEVLVAFEQGNPRVPYIVGFLWNGKQKPPSQKPELRTLKTVSGHVLEFDDSKNKEKVSLRFKGGEPSIVLDANKLSIKFSDTSYIELTSSELKIVNSTLVNINP